MKKTSLTIMLLARHLIIENTYMLFSSFSEILVKQSPDEENIHLIE